MKRLGPIILLFAAACAGAPGVPYTGPISRNQCASFDWRGAGLYDGATNKPQPTRFAHLSKTCSSHGYKADREAYFEGYEEGRTRADG